MNPSDISRNPNWRFLRDEEMPAFPEHTVREMLRRFGMEEVDGLEPWPYGPYDILAAFSFDKVRYLLKARYVGHRGERALFETHYIQKKLSELGMPVPPLFAAPNGETLLKGPDWAAWRKWTVSNHASNHEGEGEIYYEVQQVLPGQFLVPDTDTVFQAGALLADFHQVGKEVDTFLLEKSSYTQVFRKRSLEGRNRLLEHLHGMQSLTPEEARALDQVFDRTKHPSWKGSPGWSLIHGNCCPDNFLVDDPGISIVDFQEVGLGEVTDDLCSFVGTELDIPMTQSFLKGYQEKGGSLNGDDRLILYTTVVFWNLEGCVENAEHFDVSEVLERFRFLLE